MSDMQIAKVVVRGELPKGCRQCYLYSPLLHTQETPGICNITGNVMAALTPIDVLPDFCPLILEDEEKKE